MYSRTLYAVSLLNKQQAAKMLCKQQKIRNVVLYNSSIIKEHRLWFAGYCHRAMTEPIHSVLFQQPAHGKKSRQPAQNICCLVSDLSETSPYKGLGVCDINPAMNKLSKRMEGVRSGWEPKKVNQAGCKNVQPWSIINTFTPWQWKQACHQRAAYNCQHVNCSGPAQ